MSGIDLVKVLRSMAAAEDRVLMVAEDPSVIDYCAMAADRISALQSQVRDFVRTGVRVAVSVRAKEEPCECPDDDHVPECSRCQALDFYGERVETALRAELGPGGWK